MLLNLDMWNFNVDKCGVVHELKHGLVPMTQDYPTSDRRYTVLRSP